MYTLVDSLIIIGALRTNTNILAAMVKAIKDLTRWADNFHQAGVIIDIIERSRRAGRNILASFCEIVKVHSLFAGFIDYT